MRACGFAVVLCALLVGLETMGAQTQASQAGTGDVAAVHHEANFEAERQQADDLFTKGFRLQAMPLYEDLSRQDPTIAVFAERLGSGLIAAAAVEEDPAKKEALKTRGFDAYRRALKLGDNSPAVQTALGMDADQRTIGEGKAATGGYANNLPPAAVLSQNPKVQAAMHQAEVAFAKHDTATALAKYKEAAELDPHFYLASLYAGDACFSGGDYACAGEWFAKAIAIDPTIETAYRYWGDALSKSGHTAEAKVKYEQAIVANPYTRMSWNGLQQWGTLTHTAMSSPPILRPRVDISRPAGAQPQVKITLPSGVTAAMPEEITVWTIYAKCRMNIELTLQPGGRRTLQGEVGCLKAAADRAAGDIAAGKVQSAALTPGVQSLLALSRDGMLACWVLLNGGDQDVVRDYAAYRDVHRDLLIAYLDRYVIHAAGQAGSAAAPGAAAQR